MAFFLSVSASFSTTFWVWAVISRRVFSASLQIYTHTHGSRKCDLTWTEWVGNRREFETFNKTVNTDLQTHMSSKFLRMDSGIFGLVTRTAFIRTLIQCRGGKKRERKRNWPFAHSQSANKLYRELTNHNHSCLQQNYVLDMLSSAAMPLQTRLIIFSIQYTAACLERARFFYSSCQCDLSFYFLL